MTVIQAHAAMIAALAAIKPRPLPTYPEAEDYLGMSNHMRDVALAVDIYILALGREAQQNTRGRFDLANFIGPCTGAIEGNATFEFECAAKDCDDENEMYHEARYEGVG